MDPDRTPSSEAAWGRRRLLAAALLGLVRPEPVMATTALRITAIDKSGGIAVASRLLADIYDRAGLNLSIETLPVMRAGLLALSGKADGELIRIASYGQVYPQLVRVDPAYYRVAVRAYSLPARMASVRSRDDLRHYAVGSVRGMPYVQDMTENHPALTLAQDPPQLFRMLQAGRVDVALCTTLAAQTAQHVLSGRPLDVSPELARLELHHYLHERHRALAARIAKVIRHMRDSGELERLWLKYEAEAAVEAGT